MAATAWAAFVPYRQDVEAALHALRREVYRRGEYFRCDHRQWRSLTEEEFRARIVPYLAPPDDEEQVEAVVQEWRWVSALEEPDGPDSLLDWNRDEATRSVIDMVDGLSDRPERGAVSPLTDDQLVAELGSRAPSHAQVQAWLDAGGPARVRRPGEGVVVVVHDQSGPHELLFAGSSGD